MSERVCKQCGISIAHRNTGVVFCCRKCKEQYYYKNPSNALVKETLRKQCMVCGEDFETTNSLQVICSKECRKKRHAELHRIRYARRTMLKGKNLSILWL